MTTFITSLIAPGLGGGGAAFPTAFSTAIPLDIGGAGRVMPASGTQTISSPTTFTIAGGAIEGGSCEVNLLVNSTVTFPSTSPLGGGVVVKYSDGTALDAGYKWQITFGIQTGSLVIICFRLEAIDATAPTLLSATVANATPNRVDLVFIEAMNATWSAFGAFAVTGHTVTAITRLTSTTGYLTLSAPFVFGEAARTLAYTQPGTNNMQDLAGNLLANITAASITNNTLAVPVAPTGLTLGTATSTTQPLTWTAPASNGGSAITDYLVEYKASSSGTWLTFADGTGTATSATITGLIASTSYDIRVSAINPIGTGPASSTATGSTAAGGGSGRADTFTRADSTSGLGTPSDGGSAWVESNVTGAIYSNKGGWVETLTDGSLCGAYLQLAGINSAAQVTAQIDLRFSQNFPGLLFGYVDASNHYRAYIGNDGTFRVAKQTTAGGFSDIASVAITGYSATGTYTIAITRNNTTGAITATCSGSGTASITGLTDTDVTGGTKAGLSGRNDALMANQLFTAFSAS